MFSRGWGWAAGLGRDDGDGLPAGEGLHSRPEGPDTWRWEAQGGAGWRMAALVVALERRWRGAGEAQGGARDALDRRRVAQGGARDALDRRMVALDRR